ncbi:hypothetical protein Goari_019170 [Gossypium aridum]|uniref:Uncharacterized protein n=1 Tax=Gossypium aridum TaxID=34290 RepID=A0A7J8WRU8_GOSAI|nr:hypothetical protein [Gossypium aridum]
MVESTSFPSPTSLFKALFPHFFPIVPIFNPLICLQTPFQVLSLKIYST